MAALQKLTDPVCRLMRLRSSYDETGSGSMVRRRFLIVGSFPGPFYRRLADALRGQGAEVERVILNGGDLFDWRRRGGHYFRKPIDQWKSFIETLLDRREITDLVIFGDVVRYNAEALEAARLRGINTHILENGYFRPAWITLEHQGVNFYSGLPRDGQGYRMRAQTITQPLPKPIPVGAITPFHVLSYMAHYSADYLLYPVFRNFDYPFQSGSFAQGMGHLARQIWLSFLGQKKRFLAAEKKLLASKTPFFLVYLQREGDSSITRHSDFADVGAMIDHVVDNFAHHAPAHTKLVIKNHPLDPWLNNHERRTLAAAARHQVMDRVIYLDGGTFPLLTRAALGAITINSTAALAALEFGRPTKLLGRAFFDLEGLTDQQSLDRFWTTPQPPDEHLFQALRQVIIHDTQIPGSYHNPSVMQATAERLAAHMISYEAGRD